MKLEKQVCTLSQAKKLTELGLNANSLFKWREYLDEGLNLWQTAILFEGETDDDCIKYALADSSYPAFTDSELAVMLDAYYETYRTKDDRWAVVPDGITFETPAEASADRLIELLKNESLSVEACNERLLA